MPCSKALAPFVIAALVALGPLPAGAQNNAAPPPPAISHKVKLCQMCHGANGLQIGLVLAGDDRHLLNNWQTIR
ncbi:hypothetical protein ACCT25_30140, partial [Rhizobium ruizarguesonis]